MARFRQHGGNLERGLYDPVTGFFSNVVIGNNCSTPFHVTLPPSVVTLFLTRCRYTLLGSLRDFFSQYTPSTIGILCLRHRRRLSVNQKLQDVSSPRFISPACCRYSSTVSPATISGRRPNGQTHTPWALQFVAYAYQVYIIMRPLTNALCHRLQILQGPSCPPVRRFVLYVCYH